MKREDNGVHRKGTMTKAQTHVSKAYCERLNDRSDGDMKVGRHFSLEALLTAGDFRTYAVRARKPHVISVEICREGQRVDANMYGKLVTEDVGVRSVGGDVCLSFFLGGWFASAFSE